MRVVHCKREPYTHYIGRPGKLGNPFTHLTTKTLAETKVKTREASIERFKWYALHNLDILDAIKQLPADAVLGCWCKPQSCHGDVIMEIWKAYNEVQ